jgi:hypothetical protein
MKLLKLIRFWLLNTDYWDCKQCGTTNGNMRLFCGNCGMIVDLK